MWSEKWSCISFELSTNQTTLHLCWSLQQGIYCKYKYYKYIKLYKIIEKDSIFQYVMTVKYINLNILFKLWKCINSITIFTLFIIFNIYFQNVKNYIK